MMGKQNKCCATCKHWDGSEKGDVAACAAPTPVWMEYLSDELDEYDFEMAGKHGCFCACWKAKQE